MGTWGHRITENDAAADWFADLKGVAEPLAFIERSLEAGTGDDAHAAAAGLAAGLALVALRNAASKLVPEDYAAWARTAKVPDLPRETVLLAIAVANGTRGESELAQLWDEGADKSKWTREVKALEKELAGLLPTPPSKKELKALADRKRENVARGDIASARRRGAKGLDLSELNLASLPEEIGDVTTLEELHLSFNKLKELPGSLARLENLRELDLAWNPMAVLPAVLSRLPRLEKLSVCGLPLKRIDADLAAMTAVRELQWHPTSATSKKPIPAAFATLPNLRTLNLGFFNLNAVPPGLAPFHRVRSLEITYNHIAELPGEIAALTELESLLANMNRLTEFPAIVLQLCGLRELDLADNKMASIPPEIALLTRLERLRLHYNPVTPFPEALLSMGHLRELTIGGRAPMRLPDDWAELRRLEDLMVGGRVENLASIRLLTKLIRLDLVGTQAATLPDLSSLQEMESLKIGHVTLEKLPRWIAELPRLRRIDLPAEIAKQLRFKTTDIDTAEGIAAVKEYARRQGV